VTIDEAARKIAAYWIERSREALDSAAAELAAGRISFSVNRCYYACFYAASAVLVLRGARFAKHSGLRAAIHRELVKTGDLSVEAGRTYDRLFDLRQQADDAELASLTAEDGRGAIGDASRVAADLCDLARRELGVA
jgi:uncharacterized protein (UPF0332 family)